MIFSVTEIIGKTLFAIRKTNIHQLPDESSAILQTIKPGETVGRVYSYIERSGALWWQLDNNTYVLHEKNKFSTSALLEQGAIDEETKNNPNPTLTEQFSKMISGIISNLGFGISVIIAIAVLWIGIKAYKEIK